MCGSSAWESMLIYDLTMALWHPSKSPSEIPQKFQKLLPGFHQQFFLGFLGVLDEIHSEVHTFRIPPSEVLSGVPPGVSSEILKAVPAGIPSGALARIPPGKTAGILPQILWGFLKE